MLSLLKKVFRKATPPPTPSAPAPQVVSVAHTAPSASEASSPTLQVEVAHLSLAAILGKLPQDLKGNVARTPDDSATVALPLATIHKQLASGSVKMSLASLYRQAPAGTFRQARAEDKRMIEVPLNEVFRHVNPQTLRRRAEQRRADVPQGGVALFGDKNNPYALAPAEVEVEETANPEAASMVEMAETPASESTESTELVDPPAFTEPEPAPEPQRVIKPTFSFAAAEPALTLSEEPVTREVTPAAQTPPLRITNQEPATKAAGLGPTAADAEPSLLLPVADLATHWPEPIRSEALALNGSKVALPAAAVTAGLARGKVTFTWAQIRSWLTPPAPVPTQAREGTELVLPLKIVAPAFLKQKRPDTSRKAAVQVDEAIPALFSGTQPLAEKSAAVAAPDLPSVDSVPVPAPIDTPAPTTAPRPVPVEPETATTAGELFGQPDKTHWSPHDLINAAVRLPGVAGAIVALHEGLIVAAELPETLKGETLAAFLPQMFARLNAYSSEMNLGSIEDLLFSTDGAHFQAYRIGEVYFAVLGKPGEPLPWDNLRVITAELAQHAKR